MTIIKRYIKKSEAEVIEKDIQSAINGIVSKCSTLPYKRQLEAVNRIKQSLSAKKLELSEELSEIDSVLDQLT